MSLPTTLPTTLPRPLKDIAITAKKRYNLFQEHSVITFDILSKKYETRSHKKILYGIYQDMLRHTPTPPPPQTTTETASSRVKKKRTSKKMKNTPSKEKHRKALSSSSDITECAEKAI